MLGAVNGGGEWRSQNVLNGCSIRNDANNRCPRLRVVSCRLYRPPSLALIEQDSSECCLVDLALGLAQDFRLERNTLCGRLKADQAELIRHLISCLCNKLLNFFLFRSMGVHRIKHGGKLINEPELKYKYIVNKCKHHGFNTGLVNPRSKVK